MLSSAVAATLVLGSIHMILVWVCDERIGAASSFVRLGVLGVFEEDLVHVCAGILEQLAAGVENDERHLTVAKHRELHGFLHQTILPFCECDLAIALVLNALD
jgi:hypothetical protein